QARTRSARDLRPDLRQFKRRRSAVRDTASLTTLTVSHATPPNCGERRGPPAHIAPDEGCRVPDRYFARAMLRHEPGCGPWRSMPRSVDSQRMLVRWRPFTDAEPAPPPPCARFAVLHWACRSDSAFGGNP